MNPKIAPQVGPEHYESGYDHRRRFLSYFNQIDQVRQVKPAELLEVGIGNGFVSRYLRHEGYALHTVDFDERLAPDTVADVTALPFQDGEFDVACCFETLEHLPFDQFVPALRELRRVSRRYVLVSLPDVTPCLRLKLGYDFFHNLVDVARDRVWFKPKLHKFDGQHHWEIGKQGTLLPRVRSAFSEAGLTLAAVHRDYDDAYHRFFLAKK